MSVIVESAIDYVQNKRIVIIRGPIFNVDKGKVTECNWAGAVLFRHGFENLHPGWLKKLCQILDEDTYWFWRFNYGFNQGRAIQVYTEENKKQIWHIDRVSESGNQMARKLKLFK